MYILHFDGLFRGIPAHPLTTSKAGIMCYGWLIIEHDIIIARGHGAFARGVDATSNVAEYLALIEGLEALRDLGIQSQPVRVCGDAKCVIDQMRGSASVNAASMKPMYRRAQRLARNFRNLHWSWLPRSYNKAADSLTRQAMRQVRRDRKTYNAAIRAIGSGNRESLNSYKFLPLMDLRVYQPSFTLVDVAV